jgi:RsmE family RNA methyltransferase
VNLLLLEPEELGDDVSVELRGRRAHHLRAVLGVSVGDRVRVGVIRGAVGHATVREMGDDRVLLEAQLDGKPASPPSVDLVLAVPRPKVLSRVLETAAAVGVRRIDLVNAWRVDKSYLGSRRLETAALQRALRLGCEQGGGTWVPDVDVHRMLMPFLRTLSRRLASQSARCVIAHPGAPTRLEEVLPQGYAGPTILAVGPEGGWIEREVASFGDLGFRPASIGAGVLRVESAVAALLAEVGLLGRLPPRDGGPLAGGDRA